MGKVVEKKNQSGVQGRGPGSSCGFRGHWQQMGIWMVLVVKKEDEMVGWHHSHDGHEFEQAPGVGDGQGSLACCSPWGRKESDTTEHLN